MLNINRRQFPTKLFVAASLATFILLVVFFFLLKINVASDFTKQKANSADKYYLNKNYSEGDLLTTKVPSLKDMLAGPIISNLDPILGEKNAPVALVYFAVFECNFCQQQEQILKQIMADYQDRVRLIWKDYPENNEDSLSWQAAMAARCAQQQSNFWPYHDLLYQNNNNLSQLTFLNLADQLNLDRKDFVKCLDDDSVKQMIKDNIEEANALAIGGVPFIYVNDQEVTGEISLEKLKKIVEIELGKISN